MAQWLALLPYRKKVLGLELAGIGFSFNHDPDIDNGWIDGWTYPGSKINTRPCVHQIINRVCPDRAIRPKLHPTKPS